MILYGVINCLQVKSEMSANHFKPNCALVILNFMMQHGIVIPDSGIIILYIVKLCLCSQAKSSSQQSILLLFLITEPLYERLASLAHVDLFHQFFHV